ncbi:hypothetical protein PV326_002092 [Microctonus aethiopoides]|nr:hypothetical protein PV326_002092 [Microctonus aethiopoides]
MLLVDGVKEDEGDDEEDELVVLMYDCRQKSAVWNGTLDIIFVLKTSNLTLPERTSKCFMNDCQVYIRCKVYVHKKRYVTKYNHVLYYDDEENGNGFTVSGQQRLLLTSDRYGVIEINDGRAGFS